MHQNNILASADGQVVVSPFSGRFLTKFGLTPQMQTHAASPWLTVQEAADRAKCGTKTIYREVRAGRLRAARIGGRRTCRFKAEWVDAWLEERAAA